MLKKTLRQLAIFHIFIHSDFVTFETITEMIKASHKTIMRDIKDLKDAGLINVVYSKVEKGYIHIAAKELYPFLPPVYCSNKSRNMHLDKLIRLGKIMIGLRGHMEMPYWHYEDRKHRETCRSWYQRTFPQMSVRTMFRDFAELREIGYSIEYIFDEGCYCVDFPISADTLRFKDED